MEWVDGVARLRSMPMPNRMTEYALRLLIDDCEAFLSAWAAQAEDLGWTALDLWGCHPTRPRKRLDYAGLCWLLRGREIAAMTDDAATIRTATGKALTFRRRALLDDAVLAWVLTQ